MNKPAAHSTSPLEIFTPDLLSFCHAWTLIKVLMKKKYLCIRYHAYTLTIYIGVTVRETNDFFLWKEQLWTGSTSSILPIIPTASLSYVCLSTTPLNKKAWDWKLDCEPQVPPPAFLGSTDILFFALLWEENLREERAWSHCNLLQLQFRAPAPAGSDPRSTTREMKSNLWFVFFFPRRYLPTLGKLTTKFYTRNSVLANTELPLCCRDNSVPVNELSFGQMLGCGTP